MASDSSCIDPGLKRAIKTQGMKINATIINDNLQIWVLIRWGTEQRKFTEGKDPQFRTGLVMDLELF